MVDFTPSDEELWGNIMADKDDEAIISENVIEIKTTGGIIHIEKNKDCELLGFPTELLNTISGECHFVQGYDFVGILHKGDFVDAYYVSRVNWNPQKNLETERAMTEGNWLKFDSSQFCNIYKNAKGDIMKHSTNINYFTFSQARL